MKAAHVLEAQARPRPNSRVGFRGDIQGLRTIAVAAVVIYHAHASLIPGGYVGVDVFFVISGFLITNHVLKEVAADRFRFRDFYARRVRRLVPAALVVIVATLAASLLLISPLRAVSISRDGAASALYVPNIWFSFTGTDYLSDSEPSPFQQFWSLGVEEQFYLLWPLVLFLTWRLSRRSLRAVGTALAVIGLASLILCVVATPQYETWSFFNLPTRAWEFAIGSGLAIAAARGMFDLVPGPVRVLASWLGLGGLFGTMLTYNHDVTYPGAAAIMPVVATAMIIACSRDSDRFSPASILGSPPALWIGDRSYSLYLWHWPVLIIPVAAFGEQPWWFTVAMVALSVLLADVTYRLVENPARRSRMLQAIRPGRFLIASLVIAALIAAGSIAAGSALSRMPIASVHAAPSLAAVSGPELTPFVPSNGAPALQSAARDYPEASEAGCSPGRYSSEVIVCEYGNPDSEQTYALYGDSHAAQWFPVLSHIADSEDARLLVVMKASCTAIDIDQYRDGTVDTFCLDWRDDARERLVDEQVDHVFVANLHRQVGADGEILDDDTLAAATGRTVELLAPMQVTVIADTPWFEDSPVNCAAAHIDDLAACIVPTDSVVDAARVDAERNAVISSGGSYVDPTEVYCGEACGPYIGDTVVFRDRHHLTATFAAGRAEEFAAVLLGRPD